jgi:hypothetical protein
MWTFQPTGGVTPEHQNVASWSNEIHVGQRIFSKYHFGNHSAAHRAVPRVCEIIDPKVSLNAITNGDEILPVRTISKMLDDSTT